MPYETLILEKQDDVLIVTLNRPEKKNSISPQMVQEIESVLHSVSHHGHSSRAMVLKGGPGMFCAGLDLNEIPLLSDHEMGHFLQRLMDIYGAMMQTSFPIVAAIDGPAIAGGFELALMCDIRLASPKAKFGIPEISIGIPPCIDPLWKIVGMGRARELAMTGMIFDAQEAYRMGLVNRLIPSEEIFDKALDLARELAEKDPAAMGAIKQNCRMIPGMETLQALKAQDWVTKNFLDTQQKRQRMLDYIKQLGAQKS